MYQRRAIGWGQDEEEPLDVEEDEDAIEEEEEEEEENGDGLTLGVPGQFPTEKEQTKDYTAIKKPAKDKIAAMVGQEVTVSSKSSGAVTWKVITSLDPPVIYQKVILWLSMALRILI